jgi:hypothetical protein
LIAESSVDGPAIIESSVLCGLPIDVPSAKFHDVIDRPGTLLVGFNDDGGHSRTHFLGD